LKRIVEHIKPQMVFTLKNQKLPFQHQFPVDTDLLVKTISFERAFKTQKEIRMLKVAIRTSALAHNAVMMNSKEGLFEYQLQSLFESKCQQCGLTFQSYAPIFGASNRSAVLHYIENSRRIPSKPESNIMLVDAGADYNGYATDITRSFPANGKFTNEQKMIYETVLSSQKAALKTLKVGSSWSDASNAATRALLEGLKNHKFVVGDINAMIGARVQSLFMMHGLGHNLGLFVHDTGPLTILKENQVL
jgi:Xaa-Pro aminopeptidase